jgi:uncharacterized protein
MAVRMELSRILIRELNDYQIIELREVSEGGEAKAPSASVYDIGGAADEGGHSRSFPIVIGLPEAQSIERRLKGITIKRPQTHDLLASVIEKLGASLESITINDLSDHTFFATLDVVTTDGKKLHIDSRPSDAIALGIAGGVPIFVAEHVLEAATRDEV